MAKEDPIGTPVDNGPWKLGTWVWHVRTKKGPWVVVEDLGGQLVYVDTKPNRPASKVRCQLLNPHRHNVSLSHSDVEHHYRSVLTDKEPEPEPHWSTYVDWTYLGHGIGVVLLGAAVIAFMVFCGWLSLGAPH